MKPLHQPSKYYELFEQMRIRCDMCSGLCCVALYFSKLDGFPEHKKEGVACSHLQDNFLCNIHACLTQRKLTGCLRYDCFGAGQLVTKNIYSSYTWKETKNPKEIFEVFQVVYQLQEIVWYLSEASMLSIETRIDELIHEGLELTKQTPQAILSFDIERYRQDANVILKSICSRIGCFQPTSQKMFFGKDFQKKDLSRNDFSMATLIGANLSGCKLYGTNFIGADVRDTKVYNTDLSECIFLTQRQVNSMIGNLHTKLPSYLQTPTHWNR